MLTKLGVFFHRASVRRLVKARRKPEDAGSIPATGLFPPLQSSHDRCGRLVDMHQARMAVPAVDNDNQRGFSRQLGRDLRINTGFLDLGACSRNLKVALHMLPIALQTALGQPVPLPALFRISSVFPRVGSTAVLGTGRGGRFRCGVRSVCRHLPSGAPFARLLQAIWLSARQEARFRRWRQSLISPFLMPRSTAAL